VDAQPFVKAWPAEEVATERYNRLLWQLKAYVALKATPSISATAAAACRFPDICRHILILAAMDGNCHNCQKHKVDALKQESDCNF